ncbi:hypothetical protein BBJ29_005907 [Phytophthora kernoviae]|uniref:Helicase ATP-binding domain-containing protein n=1 Tax=Phytophthora kernoviae TaxID=325452 RepID=A0A421GA08_9STRA|nr:hypothetical protein BBJ29_005907 [Phytophthora kernoviae]
MAEKKSDMYDVNWQKVWPDRMPVILRDLAPTNPFNPRNLWPEEQEEEAAAAAAASAPSNAAATAKKPGKEDKKGGGKLKKADLIRMQLAKDKAQKQSKVDEEKLANVKKSKNLLDMKMVTPTGRLKQLYEILRDCCKKKEYTDAVDTLWEIQRTKLMPERSTVADGRKKHDKQKKMDDEEDAKLLNELNAVHKKYRKYVKIVNEYLSGKDLIEWQLTEMSDRLPPLNMHHMNKFILDDWQRTVLGHIDDNHSVIVCAPTSSGKTVLSSYVSVVGGKVLFIVPTDPLAWQVAALFQAMVKGSVALITEGTVFLPPGFRIAVGTPRAVESTLIDIGYDFQYAVYDEVHDLNGPEGDALERIVKAVTCPFLALSATIGNAEKLKTWWESHHTRDIHLLEYKGRFINLQRVIWYEEEVEEKDGKKQEMVYLHPCAGVTLDYLTSIGFDAGDLAFTPRDAFALWQAMEKFYPAELIEDVDPHKFFDLEDETEAAAPATASKKKEKSSKKDKKKYKKSKKSDDDDEEYIVDLGKRTHRITLMESKKYEDKIKKRLEDLASTKPKDTQSLLDFFAPPASLQGVTVELHDPRDINPTSSVDVYALVSQLCAKNLVPAIAFQLDSVRCRQLFNQLLASIEAAETAKYPNFREKVQLEYAEWEKSQATMKKRADKVKAKGKEEDDRESQAFEEKPPPDIYAPHPDFVLTPAGSRLTATEFKEIKWQLRRELSEDSDDGHALVRSLRRGIAIYNQNLPAAYLRVVQALAQAGRLAVVFSDDSLAYGVNMPFRTCCFCEDTADNVLTSLMVQQMAGRAGRRGLDRQGNILFAGLSWSRIQFLMRGLLPDVSGRKSLYPTIALQKLLSDNVTGDIMERIVSHPLHDYMIQADAPSSPKKQASYLTKSVEWMSHFNLTKPEYSLAVDVSVAKLVWECRDDPSEALGIFWILEALLKEFHHKPGDNIALQLALFNMLLRVVGREKFHPEYAHGSELAPLPGQELAWEKVSALLQTYEAKLNELGENAPEELRMRVALTDPLDGYVFRTVVENLIPQGLGTSQLNQIKKRLRHVGDRLRLMHNLLMYSGRFGELEEIVRKCFRRIKWILIDSEVPNKSSHSHRSSSGSGERNQQLDEENNGAISHFYSVEKMAESCFHATQNKNKTWLLLPGSDERSKGSNGTSSIRGSSITGVERPSRRVDVLDLDRCFDTAIQFVNKKKHLDIACDEKLSMIDRDFMAIHARIAQRYASGAATNENASESHKTLSKLLFEQKWSDVVIGELEAMLMVSFLEQGVVLRKARILYAKAFFQLEHLYKHQWQELIQEKEDLHLLREEVRQTNELHKQDGQGMKEYYESKIQKLTLNFEGVKSDMERRVTDSKDQLAKMGDTMKALNGIFRQMRDDTEKQSDLIAAQELRAARDEELRKRAKEEEEYEREEATLTTGEVTSSIPSTIVCVRSGFRVMVHTLNDEIPSYFIATLFRNAYTCGNGIVNFDSFIDAAETWQFFSTCMRLESPSAVVARLFGNPLSHTPAVASASSRAAFIVDKFFTILQNELHTTIKALPIWTRNLTDSLAYEIASSLMEGNFCDGVRLLISFYRLIDCLGVAKLVRRDITGNLFGSKDLLSIERALEALLEFVRQQDKSAVELLIDSTAFAKLSTDQKARLSQRIIEAASDRKNGAPPSRMEANAFLVFALHEWRRYIIHRLNEVRVNCCAAEEDLAQIEELLHLEAIADILKKSGIMYRSEELCVIFRRLSVTERVSKGSKVGEGGKAATSTATNDPMSDRIAAACFPMVAKEALKELLVLEKAATKRFRVQPSPLQSYELLVSTWEDYQVPCSDLLDEIRRVGKCNGVQTKSLSRSPSSNCGGGADGGDDLYLSSSSSLSSTVSSQDVAHLEAVQTDFLDKLERLTELFDKDSQSNDSRGALREVNTQEMMVNETWKAFRQMFVRFVKLRATARLGDGPLPDQWALAIVMLPMIKLGGLVARTLTKPLARVVKTRSKVHPLLNAVCSRMGQQQHRLAMKLHMGFRGISNYTIKPLPADQAVEQGADLMGEIIIFSVALGVASLEYSRSAASARVKEQKHKEQQEQDEREVKERFEYLESQVVWLEDRLEDLTHILEAEMGARLELLVQQAKSQEEELQQVSPGASRLAQRRKQIHDEKVHVGVDIDDKAAAEASLSVVKLWKATYDAVANLFK